MFFERRNLLRGYLLIAGLTLTVSAVGSKFTTAGLASWYDTLTLPSFTPPGWVIGIVWSVLFLLAAISAMMAYKQLKKRQLSMVMSAFFINGVLNVLWSAIFFGQQRIGLAIFEAAALALSVFFLIYLLWRPLRMAAILLVPYLGWVLFATYLTFRIWQLNTL